MRFVKALKRLLQTLEEQVEDMTYEKNLNQQFYTFRRVENELKKGVIQPSFKTGMIKTGFRPSDDPNDLAYNIPGNAMLSTYLDLVAKEVIPKVPQNSVYTSELQTLRVRM